MRYRNLLIAAVLAGFTAGFLLFALVNAFSDSWAAAAQLADITSLGYRAGGVVFIPAIAVGWLLTAFCSRFTGYAGWDLLPPLLVFVAVALFVAIGMARDGNPDIAPTLTDLCAQAMVVTAVSASIFEWLNL